MIPTKINGETIYLLVESIRYQLYGKETRPHAFDFKRK